MQNHYTFINTLRAKLSFKQRSYREVFLITIKHDFSIGSENHVLYFYDPLGKTILPVTTYQNIDRFVGVYSANGYEKCLKTIAGIFKCKITGVVIYLRLSDRYYVHLRLDGNKKQYEIDIDLVDALCVAKCLNIPLYMEKHLMTTIGIKVTKDLLEKALKD